MQTPLAGSSSSSSSLLASLTHLPAAMASLGFGGFGNHPKGKAKKKTHKLTPLAKEGQDLHAFYNVVAGRPYPRYVSLEQRITVEDTFTVSNFLTTSTATNSYAALAPTLGNFSMNSAYTALFDQYRIDQLEVFVEPINAQGSTSYGEVFTAVDLDDANAPTTLSIGDKQEALVGLGAAGRKHRWLPHVAIAEYSGTFTSYGNIPATFIDSASPSVQHYGFKMAAAPTPLQVVTYALTCRAVITFRAPGL